MFHTIILVGNLGRDPEMRYTPSGQSVTNFSVATSRKYTGSDGNLVDETIWFRVSAWGKMAVNCNEYLHKGDKVLVEGRLVPDKATGGPRTYTRQDGTTAASFEVSASTVQFFPKRGVEGESATIEGEGALPAESDSIPF